MPRYYLYLAIVPSLWALVQITNLRIKSVNECSIWEIIFIKAYPFIAAGIATVTIAIPQYLIGIMSKFFFTSWPALAAIICLAWIGQKVTSDKLINQEERNVIQRVTGEVTKLKKGHDTLLEKIVNGVIIIDSRGQVVLCNTEASKILSIDQERILGKQLEELLVPKTIEGINPSEGYDPLLEFKKKVMKAREPFFLHQFETKTQTEEYIALNLSVTPFSDSESMEPNQFILVFEDITERHQLEKMRRDFVNIASHELRTPLTSINGYLSLLLSGQINSEDESRLYLNRIFESTRRLSKLVKNILNVSRIDRNKMKVNFQSVDIEKVLTDELTSIENLAKEKNMKIILNNLLVQQTFVRADEDMLREIIVNLAGNAIKYSNNDSEIEVSISRSAEHRIRVEVKDHGMGIEEKNIGKLFQQFYRVENTMTEEQQGSGLGLYITKRYIDALEGTISVNSTFGAGSTFFFDLNEYSPESVSSQTIALTRADTPANVPTVEAKTTDPSASPSEASEGWKDWQNNGTKTVSNEDLINAALSGKSNQPKAG
ncbi:MAG TPA: ATP-binding protein [bacterium]|nr:ATP-binding protein [bacterium]